MNSSSKRHPTPPPPLSLKDKKKLVVGLRDIFLDFANVIFTNFTFHDNMYIGNTSCKWFLILWCSSKVDVRHLGISLVILNTVIIA